MSAPGFFGRVGAAVDFVRGRPPADPDIFSSYVRIDTPSGSSREGSRSSSRRGSGSDGEGSRDTPTSVLSGAAGRMGVPGMMNPLPPGTVQHFHTHRNDTSGDNRFTKVTCAVMLLASLAFLAFAICYSQGFFPFETFMGPIGSSVSIGAGCLFVGLSACIMLTN